MDLKRIDKISLFDFDLSAAPGSKLASVKSRFHELIRNWLRNPLPRQITLNVPMRKRLYRALLRRTRAPRTDAARKRSSIDQELILRRSTLARRLKEGFKWMFYDGSFADFEVFVFLPRENPPSDSGSALLVSERFRLGVHFVWEKGDGDKSPLDFRHHNGRHSEEVFNNCVSQIAKLGLVVEKESVDRICPFLAIQANTGDLNTFCSNNAEELGNLFTGGYEDEERQYLANYVHNNISRRRYERLFFRWTEGLAVYAVDAEEEKYENTLFRAIQVFETCMLVARLLRNVRRDADALSSSLQLIVHWRRVNRVFQSFESIKEDFILAPPIQSAEAERLLADAYEAFGIDRSVASTKESCEFLERRFAWAKTQFLGLIAILTYLGDKHGYGLYQLARSCVHFVLRYV